ncbi:MAG: hypothetical protein AAGU05_07310, partial [Anaerolineaceae bacterium]
NNQVENGHSINEHFSRINLFTTPAAFPLLSNTGKPASDRAVCKTIRRCVLGINLISGGIQLYRTTIFTGPLFPYRLGLVGR